MVKPTDLINVKIFRKYSDIIDKNLKPNMPLHEAGYTSRAQFVRFAVSEKLKELELLRET